MEQPRHLRPVLGLHKVLWDHIENHQGESRRELRWDELPLADAEGGGEAVAPFAYGLVGAEWRLDHQLEPRCDFISRHLEVRRRRLDDCGHLATVRCGPVAIGDAGTERAAVRAAEPTDLTWQRCELRLIHGGPPAVAAALDE